MICFIIYSYFLLYSGSHPRWTMKPVTEWKGAETRHTYHFVGFILGDCAKTCLENKYIGKNLFSCRRLQEDVKLVSFNLLASFFSH